MEGFRIGERPSGQSLARRGAKFSLVVLHERGGAAGQPGGREPEMMQKHDLVTVRGMVGGGPRYRWFRPGTGGVPGTGAGNKGHPGWGRAVTGFPM